MTGKTAAEYLALPYTVVLKRDDEGDFVARILELPGCVTHGATEAEAIENLREVQRLWIEESLSASQEVPLPEVEEELPSGKWLQRVPRSLHKKLSVRAKREGVSLNQLVMSILAESIGRSSSTGGALPGRKLKARAAAPSSRAEQAVTRP